MRKSVLPILLLVMATLPGFAQTSYKAHSIYIYSFTRHVIWPEALNKGDFEIHVLGECPLMSELKELSETRKVGDRPIVVTTVNSVEEIRKCHILFIPAERSADLEKVIAKVGDGPVLIVTEETGAGARGSHINFIRKEGKLVFELNQSAAAKQNLKVSSLLTSLAILI